MPNQMRTGKTWIYARQYSPIMREIGYESLFVPPRETTRHRRHRHRLPPFALARSF